MNRQIIADKIVEIIQRDIDGNFRETHGKNRSPRIDSFNTRVGVPLGSPYCASGGWCAIDDACQELGLINPVPPTGWSQAFRRPQFIPKQYIRPDGDLGQKGDVAVLQVIGKPDNGHYATLREDQIDPPLYETVEYNTDGSGSREGDGAYQMTRSTNDTSSYKIFICFSDIPQWIYDHNFIPPST